MVCVYGLSHVPALLLLEFPGFAGRSAFLVFFLVAVVQTCMVAQHVASRWTTRPPALPAISQGFGWRSWAVGMFCGGLLGALLAGITPFKPGQATAMAWVACAAATLGHLVMKAIKRDRGVPHWGAQGQSVTGASGLLDRVDALAFAAPVFFQSVRWTFGV
jgi:phosphatidate cytidylyltransferase